MAVISIKKEKPDYIAFIVSSETFKKVNVILREVKEDVGIKGTREFLIKKVTSSTEAIEEFFKAFYWLSRERKAKEIIIDATNALKTIALNVLLSASFLHVFRFLKRTLRAFRKTKKAA